MSDVNEFDENKFRRKYSGQALFSGRVAMVNGVVSHAIAHLSDLRDDAPTEKQRAVLHNLVNRAIFIGTAMEEFLKECKDMEQAKHITTQSEEPKNG